MVNINVLETIHFEMDPVVKNLFSLNLENALSQSSHKFEFGEIQLVENPEQNSLNLFIEEKEKMTIEKWRKAGGKLSRFLRKHQIYKLFISKETALEFSQSMVPFFEGIFLGSYSFDTYKSKKQSENIDIYCPIEDRSFQNQILDVQVLSSVVNLARELGHLPANIINPPSLADLCITLAQEKNIKIKVYDEKELEQMGAGALLAVGKGSVSKPRLIILEYCPKARKDDQPVVLVGKAITFDTGGYSLKTVDGIKGMKYDKMGGVAVLGTLLAAASLNLPVNLVGIVCAAENMISDDAFRPDDIIQTLSGKTVEILSTDAEGRLVLADGLTYAQRHYKPACIVDFATLTGGIVVALGSLRAGLFSNDQKLSDQLFQSGERTSEKLWPMPLDEEYFELIKGDDADIKNAGGREAHPITGAMFLKQFIESDVPWAHLDIAGAATSSKAENYLPKGPTGFGVRLMVDFLKNL